MAEPLESAHKFQLWKSRIESNGLQVSQIDELYSRRNTEGNILFSLLYTHAKTPEGDKIPPICFLKGEVVCVAVVLVEPQLQEKYLLLVRQRRICDGSMTYEHPAGMLDSESDSLSVAVREVEEETGLPVRPEQLVALNTTPFFPSTGTSDEAMYFYYCELEMDAAQISAFHNQAQGVASEHERITTHVVPFAEGHRLITNTNGILLNFLYLKAVGDWSLMQRI